MSQSFTVKNAAAADKVFTPGVQTLGAQTYVGADSTGTATQLALVKHTFGIEKGKIDKHLLQFTQNRANAAGLRGTVTVNVTVAVPPNGATAADLSDVIAFAKEFLGSATLVPKLLNGTI